MVTDEAGSVVWTERFRPFGDEEAQSGSLANDYRFTGKHFDLHADLYYFNARWYDKDVGRFISQDPLWGNIRDPQSLNRFAYGRNNPFKYTDPTGKMTYSPTEEICIGDGTDAGGGAFSDYDFEQAFGDGDDSLTAREWYQDWISIVPAYNLALDYWFMREMRRHVGTPYSSGGNDPHNGGADCSGIVVHVLETMGFNVPDHGADYIADNWAHSVANPRAGTLQAYDYFRTQPDGSIKDPDGIVDHLTTVINNDRMVHPSSGQNTMKVLETTRTYNGPNYELRGMTWRGF